jgi:hypothetical protein
MPNVSREVAETVLMLLGFILHNVVKLEATLLVDMLDDLLIVHILLLDSVSTRSNVLWLFKFNLVHQK